MNQYKPSSGNGLRNSPATVLADNEKAGLAAVCFWKIYFIDNAQQRQIADQAGQSDGYEKVLRIMNSGSASGMVYDRLTQQLTSDASSEVKRRFATMQRLQKADSDCARAMDRNE